ncbi:MAG: hypothetical protein NTW12_08200 [Deltaproteobacteria bacterium]|nr:hypothetical protein [Deltaproteobacteria bacterium]
MAQYENLPIYRKVISELKRGMIYFLYGTVDVLDMLSVFAGTVAVFCVLLTFKKEDGIMRINKGLLIYVRLMIVGLVVLFGVLTIIASVPKPKPTPTLRWYKPGFTPEGFAKDRYACLKESQQRVSEYSREGRSSASSSAVITNDNLFNACMNARGWILQDETITIQEQKKQKKAKSDDS